MKRYLKLYPKYLAMAIKSKLAYRTDAFFGILGFIVSNVANFCVLYLMISPISSIVTDGITWDINMLMFLYGCLLLPKGIDHMFTDNLWPFAGWLLRDGDIDKYLTKPLSPLFQVIAGDFQYEGFGEVILGISFTSIFGSRISGYAWGVNELLPLALCLFCAIFVFSSIKLFFATISFWTKTSITLMNSIYSLNDFARYPLQIFGGVIKNIMLWIVPFGLVIYMPVYFLFSGGNMWILLSIVFGISSLFLLIYVAFFNFGLKNYESAGS